MDIKMKDILSYTQNCMVCNVTVADSKGLWNF